MILLHCTKHFVFLLRPVPHLITTLRNLHTSGLQNLIMNDYPEFKGFVETKSKSSECVWDSAVGKKQLPEEHLEHLVCHVAWWLLGPTSWTFPKVGDKNLPVCFGISFTRSTQSFSLSNGVLSPLCSLNRRGAHFIWWDLRPINILSAWLLNICWLQLIDVHWKQGMSMMH